MQVRERRKVIQVIRTTSDPDLKRGRDEIRAAWDELKTALRRVEPPSPAKGRKS